MQRLRPVTNSLVLVLVVVAAACGKAPDDQPASPIPDGKGGEYGAPRWEGREPTAGWSTAHFRGRPLSDYLSSAETGPKWSIQECIIAFSGALGEGASAQLADAVVSEFRTSEAQLAVFEANLWAAEFALEHIVDRAREFGDPESDERLRWSILWFVLRPKANGSQANLASQLERLEPANAFMLFSLLRLYGSSAFPIARQLLDWALNSESMQIRMLVHEALAAEASRDSSLARQFSELAASLPK